MKHIFIFFMIIVCFSLKAQQTGNVEKSIFNFQFGTVGAWLSNEAKLLDNLALRTEIGLYTEIVSGNTFFCSFTSIMGNFKNIRTITCFNSEKICTVITYI